VPFTVEHDSAARLVQVTVTGQASPELFREALAALTASGEFPADIDTLWDLRAVDFQGIDDRFVRTLVGIRRGEYATRGQARVAILVGNDLQFGLGRQFELIAGDAMAGVGVFRTPEEARAWLRGS
jgi:hypothetical protein